MKNLIEALIKAQQEFPKIIKDREGMHRAKYAELSSLIEQTKPVLNKNGLSVIQTMEFDTVEGKIVTVVKTYLLHSSGEQIESKMPFVQSSNPQETGKFITYYRRYSYQSILGISTEDDDDADSVVQRQDNKKVEQGKKEPSEFVLSVKKFKGMKLGEVPIEEIRNYYDWLSKQDRPHNDAKVMKYWLELKNG